MGVDCSNPTNSVGGTAASPWVGIEAVSADYNSWVRYIEEANRLLKLSFASLKSAVVPKLQEKDPQSVSLEVVARLMTKMAGYEAKTQFIDTTAWPTFTDRNSETLKLRDLAVNGCALLEQAAMWLRRYDVEPEWGALKTWEEARKKGPPGWRSILGWGAVVLGVVAVVGAAGYAVTAIASARRAGAGPKKVGNGQRQAAR